MTPYRQLIRFSSTQSAKLPKLVGVPNKFNSKHSASNVKPNYQSGQLYHHPSPSTPSHVETPQAFLPSNDPRKGLDLSGKSSLLRPSLAPALSQPVQQELKLTPKEVDEIRSLRSNDPEQWTRGALAKKFGVSGFTISLVSDANAERAAEMEDRLGQIKGMWSEGRKKARQDREKRKVSWYRDE